MFWTQLKNDRDSSNIFYHVYNPFHKVLNVRKQYLKESLPFFVFRELQLIQHYLSIFFFCSNFYRGFNGRKSLNTWQVAFLSWWSLDYFTVIKMFSFFFDLVKDVNLTLIFHSVTNLKKWKRQWWLLGNQSSMSRYWWVSY